MNDVADLPAQSNSAVRNTEGMNSWFQQSLKNSLPWFNELIAAGIKQALAGGSPYMESLLDEIGAAYAEERRERRKEVEAAADESKRWFCVSWGEPIPARLEQALTDPKQPYQIGFRDGYEQAKREIRDETYLAVARIETMTTELVRMRTSDGAAAQNKSDPPTRPN
jgi:hypothetical protein